MYGCIVESHGSTRHRTESLLSKTHEDRIAWKGITSMTHYNLVHKFIPMPQAMKIPNVKAAVEKEWQKVARQFQHETQEKSEARREVILEAQRDNTKVHFATLMDICHLKNAELEPILQKYRGWIVLYGDIVKDDSGAYAVFTEPGSSASQMAAAKIMDVIARLPGCAGQATDAVSAYTQAKLEDAPRLLKSPKSECTDVWIRVARHKCQNQGTELKIPWYLLNETFHGHPLAGLLWERQFEEALLELGWEKIPNWECMFFHRKQRLCSFCMWHLMVSKQACKISHKMDSGMWQTISKADNIVVCETQHSTADRVCSKTQTLLANSRTPNQLQVVSCVLLEVELLSQSVGCTRNKLRFRTALLNQRSYRWMLDYVWMGYLLLIFWDIVIEVLQTAKDNIEPKPH